MTWRSAPTILVQLRTMLGNCSSWTGAGGASGQIHYPQRRDADSTFPSIVLYHETRRRHVATGTTIEAGTLTMYLEAYGRYSDAISAVDSGAGTIGVASDITDQIAAGDEFYIDGSTDNDGWYVASSVAFAGGVTTVTIDSANASDLTSDTVDGNVLTGSVEDLADQIAKDLLAQDTGLPLTGAGRTGPAMFPDGNEDEDGSEINTIAARIEAETGLDTGG